ncbi:MAG: DUF2334 domain-containing protein [Candidatus Woesearchaeota archaeon]
MKFLAIAIHDFTPAYASELKEMLQELDVHGLNKRTVALIPNFMQLGKSYPLDKDEASFFMLENEKVLGNDFMLHGYDHSKGKFLDREFKNISCNEASKKIDFGLQTLKSMRLMLSPLGFSAPFWKLGNEGRKAVKNSGFKYIEHNPGIEDLVTGEIYGSRALWCWPCNKVLDNMFRLYDKFLAWKQKDNELVRVALHPQDIMNEKTFNFELEMIEELRKERELITYSQYLLPKWLRVHSET